MNATYIRLMDSDEGHIISAPAGFDWLSYPRKLNVEGREWRYLGTLDGIPYYSPEAR